MVCAADRSLVIRARGESFLPARALFPKPLSLLPQLALRFAQAFLRIFKLSNLVFLFGEFAFQVDDSTFQFPLLISVNVFAGLSVSQAFLCAVNFSMFRLAIFQLLSVIGRVRLEPGAAIREILTSLRRFLRPALARVQLNPVAVNFLAQVLVLKAQLLTLGLEFRTALFYGLDLVDRCFQLLFQFADFAYQFPVVFGRLAVGHGRLVKLRLRRCEPLAKVRDLLLTLLMRFEQLLIVQSRALFNCADLLCILFACRKLASQRLGLLEQLRVLRRQLVCLPHQFGKTGLQLSMPFDDRFALGESFVKPFFICLKLASKRGSLFLQMLVFKL